MMASRACPPSLTGSWPRRPATPTSQRLGPLQGTPNARPITLIRIGPRGAAGERSLLLRPTRCPCAWFTSRHFQVCFCSISRHSSLRLQCPKRVESRCGAVTLGRTYPLPPLSFGGALVVPPSLRFHIPLIEPDRRISRIRLSDKTSRFRVQRHLQLLNIYWS